MQQRVLQVAIYAAATNIPPLNAVLIPSYKGCEVEMRFSLLKHAPSVLK